MLQAESFDELLHEAGERFGAKAFLLDDPLLGRVSYRDLWSFRNGLERQFEELAIPEGAAVASIFHNCGLSALLFLSVIACRRLYVPLNPTSSPNELQYMLDKAECTAIVFDPAHFKVTDFGDKHQIEVSEHQQFYTNCCARGSVPTAPFNQDKSEFFIGEVVYTSGSTGHPKGAVLSEQNLLANALALAHAYELGEDDRFLTVCPLFHNSGQVLTTLTCTLVGGSTAVVKSDIGMLNFWRYVDRYQANWSLGMVSFLALLLARPEQPSNPTTMKGLLTGGSAIDAGLIQAFERRFGVPVRTVYGLTESASIATCEHRDPSPRSLGSSGRALTGCDVRIGAEDPISSATANDPRSRHKGEIWISGPTIFHGYVGDPDLTRSRKIGGWLRTGDIGYFDESGNLFVVDRLDSMLIVGGENVYPAEVEKLCTLLPGAAQVVVVGVDDTIWGTKLVLVYRAENKDRVDTMAWHRILAEQLSPFKIPQAYVAISTLGLDEFPRRENGKLDRPAITAIIKSRFSESGSAGSN